MVSEIWTAVRKEESNEEDNSYIIFEVEDKGTDEVRIERRYEKAIPLMLMLGGYRLSVCDEYCDANTAIPLALSQGG